MNWEEVRERESFANFETREHISLVSLSIFLTRDQGLQFIDQVSREPSRERENERQSTQRRQE